MNKPPHIFAGVIARHQLTVATSVTLQRVAVGCRELGINFSMEIEETGGISLARNLLTERFYDRTRADWFLSMDDDVGRLTANDLLRMISHGVDVVGAPLPGRGVAPHSVQRAIKAGEPMDSYLNIHENLSGLLVRFIDGKPVVAGRDLVEVESTSAGCLLVSRLAMGKMIDKLGRFAFGGDERGNGVRNPPRVWNFTEAIPDDSYQFCRHWRELGGKVYVDAKTTLSHRGVVDFTTKPLATLLGMQP